MTMFTMAAIALGCIDFEQRLTDCRAGRSGCTPELLRPTTDGGAACDGGACGNACQPACAAEQTCFAGACLGRACTDGTCSPDQVCLDGRCTQTTCLRIPCDSQFTCVRGGCEPRACGAVTCAEGAACVDGGCIDVSCTGVVCDGGQCHNGSCQSLNLCPGKVAGQACEGDRVCNQTGVCVSCTAGASCTTNPNRGCFSGVTSCALGVQTCVDAQQAPPGTACGQKSVCNAGGSCVECEAGKECTTNPSMCRLGAIACNTGGPLCVDADPKKSSEPCGASSFCDGTGFCGSCTLGEACTSNAGPCFAGVTACPGGNRTCVDGAPKAAGASCGANQVCDQAHACQTCNAGEACTTNPKSCFTGATSCSSGVRACIDGSPKLAGASCGVNQVCDAAHSCIDCAAGEPCTANSNACFDGVIACANGLRSCIDGAPKVAGSSCGANQFCDAAHACNACVAGAACTTNANACFDGVTACTNGARVCIDGAAKSAGASCGTNQFCDSSHVCSGCTAGEACTSNPNTCFSGVTACANGARSCADGAPKAAGASCGTNQFCDSAHACNACTAGEACTSNPNACFAGAIACTNGTRVCVDGASKAAGAICGPNQFCDSAHACNTCTAGEACTSNPNACFAGAFACTNGTRVCVDAAPKAAGASCGTNQVCDSAHVCGACTENAACTMNPGAPCAPGKTQCATGRPVCVDAAAPQSQIFYRDADLDGSGSPTVTQTVCGANPAAPPGYVANKNDCCDADARAKPGQTGFFADANACGSFDYDCSGASDAQYTRGFTGCTFTAVCGGNGLGDPCTVGGTPGWGAPAADPQNRNKAFVTTNTVPACGASGLYVNGCGTVGNCGGNNCACSHKLACEFDVVSAMKQACH